MLIKRIDATSSLISFHARPTLFFGSRFKVIAMYIPNFILIVLN